MTPFRSPSAPVPSTPLVILVVDDNPISRYATARQLSASGFSVEEAATGVQGLQKARAELAAIVLDVHLPDLDGFEVCRRLRSRDDTARVPVLYLSAAHVRDIDKVRGLESGADAYMTHPVEPELLAATVRTLVRARNAEEELRASERRLQAIYDLLPSGISLLDNNGRVLTANPAMLALLGRAREEVERRPLVELLPEAMQSSARRLLAEACDAPRSEELKTGSESGTRHLALTVAPSGYRGQRLVVANDITERVSLAQKRDLLLERETSARVAFERLSRSKDEFIAILSHELRTPLNVIMSWAHVLRGLVTTPAQEKGVDAIERNARTQARIIEDLLDMSRMDVGKMRLDLEEADAVEVVQTAVDSLADTARRKEVRITVRAAERPLPMRVDSARLQQIVWNLVSNAIKFSDNGAGVQVMVDRVAPRHMRLTVHDDGRGIEQSFLPYLFDRFTQHDMASVRKHGGLGLGLSIVRRLAELHGGSVGADSEGPGMGSSIWVELPLDGPLHAEDQTETFAPGDQTGEFASLAGEQLLLVEDDEDSASMLRVVLESYGLVVRAVPSAAAALSEIERERPEVVVSDIGLVGEDGYLLARNIRRREAEAGVRRLPLVALTAFARPKDRQLAFESGFDAHVSKPFVAQALLSTLQSLLSQSRTAAGHFAEGWQPDRPE